MTNQFEPLAGLSSSKFDRISRAARDVVDSAAHDLAKFQQNFAQNPLYAFEWSMSAITAAAQNDVGQAVLGWLSAEGKDPEAQAELVIRELTRLALRGARYPERSSSPTSNLAAQERAAACAALLERITQ